MEIYAYIDSMKPAGGIERVVSKLTKLWVEELQWEVTLLTKDGEESFYELNKKVKIDSFFLSKKKMSNFKGIRAIQIFFNIMNERKKVKQYFKNKKFNYIYSTTPTNTMVLYLAGYGKKVIASEHGSYYGYNKVYRMMKRLIYPRIKVVNTLTEEDAKIYKSLGSEVFCIPNPLTFLPQEVSTLKNKVVLNVGRFVSDKGQDILIEVWKKVSLIYPNWKLRIVGSGEKKEELFQQIKKLELEDKVFLIDAHKNISNEYLNSSIFVLSSRYEGFGMVLTEAMSFGVPCVAFDCPTGPRHIIKHNEDGFLIEPKNEDAMIKQIIELIQNENKRLRFGMKARENMNRFSDSELSKMWLKNL